MNQKGFVVVLIMLGVVAVLGLVGGAYYFGKAQTPKLQPQNTVVVSQPPQPTSTPDETANWKIYTNQQYGYLIKYPTDKLVQLLEVCPAYKGFAEGNLILRDKTVQECLPDIPSNLVISSDSNLPDDKDQCLSVTKTEVIVDGIKAKKYTSVFNSQDKKCTGQGLSQVAPKTISIFLDRNNQKLSVTYMPYELNESLFEKILSTFKFLDQTQPIPNIDKTGCSSDGDCGVNTCSCTAQRKDSLEKISCAMICAGEAKCIDNRCVFVKNN